MNWTNRHLTADRQLQRATLDLLDGLQRWRLWTSLAWQEIRQRYRRSLLGPFWLTLTMAILIGGIGYTYSALFGLSAHEYVPYVALGFIIWNLISGMLNDSCTLFLQSSNLIKQIPVPLSLYVYKMVWKNLIIFGHNFVIYGAILVIFGFWPGLNNLALAALGLALLCVNGVWTGLVLSIVSTRFRDVPQIVTSLVAVAFFLTPIFWHPGQLSRNMLIVDYNPLRYYIDVVRLPLLGESPPNHYWIVVLICTLMGLAIAFMLFTRFRRRIIYWL